MPTQERILAARDILLAGDQAALGALLVAEPELTFERVGSILRPYDGYFHGAILLHHVAANPLIRPLPENPRARAGRQGLSRQETG